MASRDLRSLNALYSAGTVRNPKWEFLISSIINNGYHSDLLRENGRHLINELATRTSSRSAFIPMIFSFINLPEYLRVDTCNRTAGTYYSYMWWFDAVHLADRGKPPVYFNSEPILDCPLVSLLVILRSTLGEDVGNQDMAMVTELARLTPAEDTELLSAAILRMLECGSLGSNGSLPVAILAIAKGNPSVCKQVLVNFGGYDAPSVETGSIVINKLTTLRSSTTLFGQIKEALA